MRVVLSAAARLDILGIYEYAAEDDFEAIDRLVDELDTAMQRLGDWPELGRPRPELRAGLRSLPSGNYLIFYQLGSQAVEILRVVHGRRDVDALF